MRLFKSSNKSQASLDRLTGSRDHSPTQQPDPTYPHAQPYSGPPPPSAYPPHQYQQQQHQHQQQLQPPPQHHQPPPEAYYTEHRAQQHPAHLVNRTQSSRGAPGVGDPYAQDQQPTVNIVPPVTIPVQQPQFLPGQTQFGQAQTVRTDKEHKKSKRSIFGFASKKEDKEETSDRRSVGRASSILKKGGPHSPQTLQTSPKSPSQHFPDPRQVSPAERFSSEHLPEDPDHYNQYRESQDQYRPQDPYDSPQSQHPRQSVQYVEDSRYQPQRVPSQHGPPQSDRHLIYQLSGSADSSENNLPYRPSRGSAATQETNSALRPPSQTSFGPPSPLVGQPQPESRPSTSNTQQQRYSTHSQQQQVPQQQPQIQHPQPQYQHQQNSLPPSQQPTPQPTPQPSIVQQQTQPTPPAEQQTPQQQQPQQPQPLPPPAQTQQTPNHSQQPSVVSNMPRGETANGRRHDDHLYSQQDPRIRTQHEQQGTQGRSTPPPNRGREDLSSLDHNQLMAKHEELLAKYSKVKRYYFEREAQVTQLQNTVANQRLSMSKTSLDDAGYTTRFERLNGAIQNLSFNIRKDWRRVPNWLTPVCNRDAHTVGTKEMTAVGRACITRWLYESIFERVFHPGIDPTLSAHLKSIERTLRRGQYGSALTSDQQDDLLTKITTWRLTTVEGLQDVLNSRQSEIYTETLVMALTKQIESYLRTFLADPPPPGLTDGLGSIIGQTISIAQNIPLESRDICIEYFMPGSHITEAYMRLETGMTILSQPGSAPTASDILPSPNDNEDQNSTSSSQMEASSMNVEEAIRESAKAASASAQGPGVQQRNESISSTSTNNNPKLTQQNSNSSSKEKKGFLGGFVNKKPTPAPNPSMHEQSRPNDGPDHSYNLQSLTGGTTDNKIRFAAFLAVEVRGRNVLKDAGAKDGNEKNSGSSKDGDDKKDSASGSGDGGARSASAATGVQKSSSVAANILFKAPVYAFE